jgi:bacteriorhodopsin
LGWITLLGTVSLLVFLAFELHRVFDKKRWWPYVVDVSDFAMLAIVYHGFKLGSSLQHGWYKYVWWFYAITLALVLIRKYVVRFQNKKNPAG